MAVCSLQNHSAFPCSCWLSLEDGAIWAFVAPAMFVILVGTTTAAAPCLCQPPAGLAQAWAHTWCQPRETSTALNSPRILGSCSKFLGVYQFVHINSHTVNFITQRQR